MLGKIFSGYVGHRIGERYGNNGLRGTLLGAGAGAIARRNAGPFALLFAGSYVARKVLDRLNKGGRRPY